MTNSLKHSTFSCWKRRFKTQVSACSGSPSEAMLWIKKVEMVDSVDDFKSSRSMQGYTHFPNLEMQDARIASALNNIIQNYYFKKKVSLEEQTEGWKRMGSLAEDRSLTRSATTFESLVLMIQFLIMRSYSLSLFETTRFRTSIRDGMKSYCP